jgi:hypothetical protein
VSGNASPIATSKPTQTQDSPCDTDGLTRSEQAKAVEAAFRGERLCGGWCERYYPEGQLHDDFGIFTSENGPMCDDCWDVMVANIDAMQFVANKRTFSLSSRKY